MATTTPSPDEEAPDFEESGAFLAGPPDEHPGLRDASWDDVTIHASTRKSLIASGVTVWHVYRIVTLHGWQGIMDIMRWDEAKMQRLVDALESSGYPPLHDDKERREVRRAKAKRRALCITCERREKMKGKQKCQWCWLLSRPIEEQIRHAELRLELAPEPHRARVPEKEWPAGERWCAGCQTFVPTTYATGSRCKACASRASHASRLKRVYGITREEYEELEALQDGRCWVCHRRSKSKRLAVDHDHATGEVRGLLCSGDEGCNYKIIGTIESYGGLDVARRIVDYLEEPPARRLFGKRVGRIDPEQSYGDLYDPFA